MALEEKRAMKWKKFLAREFLVAISFGLGWIILTIVMIFIPSDWIFGYSQEISLFEDIGHALPIIALISYFVYWCIRITIWSIKTLQS
jgi:hypothetical protein